MFKVADVITVSRSRLGVVSICSFAPLCPLFFILGKKCILHKLFSKIYVIGFMNLSGIILGYFYTVVLSLWVIALPQYSHSIVEDNSTQLEVFSEESSSLEQPDKFYLLTPGNNLYTGSIQGFGHPEMGLLFQGFSLQDLYWKNFGAAALSFLAAVNIKSKATDFIFPFHFFW